MNTQSNVEKSIAAILSVARLNPNITSASLTDEMERGAVDGWMVLDSVRVGNFSQWTAAMTAAATELKRLESRKAASFARCKAA